MRGAASANSEKRNWRASFFLLCLRGGHRATDREKSSKQRGRKKETAAEEEKKSCAKT